MIGDVLKVRYEIVDLISDGPIFTAYKAKDKVQGRDVTIRTLKPQFAQEEEFVAAIRQTVDRYQNVFGMGIESMISVEDADGQSFIVSEYTSGASLQERIDKLAPFSVSVAVSTAISICEGLNTLHHGGVAHGDVTARNIVVQPDGQCRLQLAGLWEAYSASQTAGLVALPGMAPYLAPEVSAGSLPSPASDVYSLGIALYQLLSGRLPYAAESPTSMALKHANSGVPSVKVYNSAVPAVLDEIVKKAMAKDPAHRYESASDLLSDLRILQDGLRFGRVLTWPLKPAPTVTGATDKKPVAPKMSAIRETPENGKQRKEKEPRDVPVWLVMLFTFFGAIFLVLLGIWVVFNVSQPKLVVVPNIKGSKLAEATKTLKALNLKIRVTGREVNDVQPPDTILSMNPSAGSKRHEGSYVGVKISSGSRYVTVPDLQGVTLDKARSMLEAINLTLSENYSTQPSAKHDVGLIVSQSPSPKAKVDRFGRVTVVVSSGKTGVSVTLDPERDKQYLYTVRIKLTGLEERVVLRVDIVDSHGVRSIYESPHEPGDSVEIPAQGYGRQATFNIYYDNQLVTTKEQQAEGEAPPPE